MAIVALREKPRLIPGPFDIYGGANPAFGGMTFCVIVKLINL